MAHTEIELKKMLIAEMSGQAERQNRTHQFANQDIWTIMFACPKLVLKSCKALGLVDATAKIKK